MAHRSTPRLTVAPPTLEPDAVLLHQLAELSASSTPAARTARHAGARALAAAATVAVIGGTTWVAGAAAGPDLGGPAQRPSTAATGVPTLGGTVGTPQSDITSFAPGSPWSPGLPGDETSPRDGAPHEPGNQPPRDTPAHSKDRGAGDGTGNGHGRGHAFGHEKTPPGLENKDRPHGNSGSHRHDESGGGHGQRNGDGNGSRNRNGKAEGHHQSRGKGHSKGHSKGKGRR